MDKTSIGGLGLALLALVISVFLDHGSLMALVNSSAFVLIIGGTVGATAISYGIGDLAQVGRLLSIAFKEAQEDPREVVKLLVQFAEYARREGLLALDSRLSEIHDAFLMQGMQAVVDGVDPELVRSLLETELNFIEERHRIGASIFETMGGFAPTMGIIGTVMGLVHVLSNLSSASSLGPAIATAFTATLYGIASANLIWLPIAGKLKTRSREEMLRRGIMLEGILSIQAGDNPRVLADKLAAFLPPRLRTELVDSHGGAADQEERLGA